MPQPEALFVQVLLLAREMKLMKLGRIALDGMDAPAEIARRETRLQALAVAKRKIAVRAQERFEREQAEYQQQAKRQAHRDTGEKPGVGSLSHRLPALGIMTR